jgi:hypothetical protein
LYFLVVFILPTGFTVLPSYIPLMDSICLSFYKDTNFKFNRPGVPVNGQNLPYNKSNPPDNNWDS